MLFFFFADRTVWKRGRNHQIKNFNVSLSSVQPKIDMDLPNALKDERGQKR